MRVIERVAEHYDVQEMPFARLYRWSPEQVVVECSKCAKRTTHTRSEIIGSEVTSCECGEGHAARIREELVIELIDEEYEAHHHPWYHDAQAQAKQHLRDEAAHSKASPWYYNDVSAHNVDEERSRRRGQ
jgi:hypothetical protein